MKHELKLQIRNMEGMVNTFLMSCQMATLMDDGVTDKKEQKELERIRKACEKFLKELNRIE